MSGNCKEQDEKIVCLSSPEVYRENRSGHSDKIYHNEYSYFHMPTVLVGLTSDLTEYAIVFHDGPDLTKLI